MSSFKERFKDRAAVIGRDGENALAPGGAVPGQQPSSRGSSLGALPPNPPSRGASSGGAPAAILHPQRNVAPIASSSSSSGGFAVQQQQLQQQQTPLFSFKPGAMIQAHHAATPQNQTRLPPIAGTATQLQSSQQLVAPRSAPAQGRTNSSISLGGSVSNGGNNTSRTTSASAVTGGSSRPLGMPVVMPMNSANLSLVDTTTASSAYSSSPQQQQPYEGCRNPFGAGGFSLFGGAAALGNGDNAGGPKRHVSLFGGAHQSPLRASPRPSMVKPLAEMDYGGGDSSDDDNEIAPHHKHSPVGIQSSTGGAIFRPHQQQPVRTLQPENFMPQQLPPVAPSPSLFPGTRGIPAPPPFASVSPSKSIWTDDEPHTAHGNGNYTPSSLGATPVRSAVVPGVMTRRSGGGNAAAGTRASSTTSSSRRQQKRKHSNASDQQQQQQRQKEVAAVDYKPYTLDDFRKLREHDAATVARARARGLGPNDSDDVRKARELRNRGKEYGESNNKINVTVLPHQARSSQPLGVPTVTPELAEAKERRERAIEFARNHVPKPKVRTESSSAALLSSSTGSGDGAHYLSPTAQHGLSPGQIQAAHRRDRLMELEAQHERDMQMVAALKVHLKL